MQVKSKVMIALIAVAALSAGAVAAQTTTEVPEVVKTTEIREAEIVQRKGQTVIYRDARTDKLHMVTGIPEGWTVIRNGKQVPIEALAGGDRVTDEVGGRPNDLGDVLVKLAGAGRHG